MEEPPGGRVRILSRETGIGRAAPERVRQTPKPVFHGDRTWPVFYGDRTRPGGSVRAARPDRAPERSVPGSGRPGSRAIRASRPAPDTPRKQPSGR